MLQVTFIRRKTQKLSTIEMATTVETVDLTTGKIVKETAALQENNRFSVYKVEELTKFTELLALPCVLNDDEILQQKKKQGGKKKKSTWLLALL